MPFPPTDPLGEQWRTAINEVLHSVTRNFNELLVATDGNLAPLSEVATSYLRGGKRIRPAFAYWAYLGANGEIVSPVEEQQILERLSALELLHAGLLVHDDLIDDAPTRRTQPSAHTALAAYYSDAHDPVRLAASAAILLGTMLIEHAHELLAEFTNKGYSPPPQALRSFHTTTRQVLTGQYLDLLAEQLPTHTAQQLESKVALLKTGSYTVWGPLRLGLALANCSDDTLKKALDGYAAAVGMGYQLCDDLLDLFGDPALTGKIPGGDIRRGKRTKLIEDALQRANRTDHAVILANLGNPDADITTVQAAVKRTGAHQAMTTCLAQLATQATESLTAVTLKANAKTALCKLAQLALFRER
ncbi:MAG: polyprenyl synthetase family protein [Propionibacteriaceae bacterium]|jgi:geranylgeranyl diphosphate synthase type I|nr:polyprenyl synthetase family protein [Propionibacteriaceae bacterium]